MSAGQDFASIRSSSVLGVISAVPPRPSNSTALRPLEGRPAASRVTGTRLDRCNRRV
jgi:hypothetical protein